MKFIQLDTRASFQLIQSLQTRHKYIYFFTWFFAIYIYFWSFLCVHSHTFRGSIKLPSNHIQKKNTQKIAVGLPRSQCHAIARVPQRVDHTNHTTKARSQNKKHHPPLFKKSKQISLNVRHAPTIRTINGHQSSKCFSHINMIYHPLTNTALILPYIIRTGSEYSSAQCK